MTCLRAPYEDHKNQPAKLPRLRGAVEIDLEGGKNLLLHGENGAGNIVLHEQAGPVGCAQSIDQVRLRSTDKLLFF